MVSTHVNGQVRFGYALKGFYSIILTCFEESFFFLIFVHKFKELVSVKLADKQNKILGALCVL